ncbi:MAG TPA: high-affinity nickel-transport family protein [Candidatus Binatia bacterium]|nr:high-affinity nickel-transport family protein [Candidatus Binatia bacterium]
MSPAAPLLLGLALGMRHALDADHLVAMSTIVTRERSIGRAALLGGAWGAGHSLSLFVVGLLVVVFRIPMGPALGAFFERLVGVMLIVLGLASLFVRHRHRHAGAEPEPAPLSRRRPFGVGIVHGLAGSGALAIAVLATISSRAGALLTILLFGVGAIGGMMAITSVMALPARFGAGAWRGASWISVAAALGSVVFGIFYLTVWA